jgi:hypothetical protein
VLGLQGRLGLMSRLVNATINNVYGRLVVPSYFPPRSTLSFSFSFICLTVGSREVSPVVWVVVAGGALLGTDCS